MSLKCVEKTTYPYNGLATAPLLSRLAPGMMLAEDTVTLYGANFGTRSITETQVITYSYDALSRLTGAYYTSDGFSYLYQYDATGNRTQFDHCLTGQPCNTTTYTYNEANRLETSNNRGGQVTYQYDANGNLTTEGGKTYTYDAANRLTHYALGEPPNTMESTFTYNGLGDRLTQTVGGQAGNYLHIRHCYRVIPGGGR